MPKAVWARLEGVNGAEGSRGGGRAASPPVRRFCFLADLPPSFLALGLLLGVEGAKPPVGGGPKGGQSPRGSARFLRRVLRSRRADRADAAGLVFAFSPAGRDYFA